VNAKQPVHIPVLQTTEMLNKIIIQECQIPVQMLCHYFIE